MDLNIDPLMLSILLGTVLPILVGLVTKRVADRGLKAASLAFLSAATGVLSAAQTNDGLITKETLFFAAAAWATAVATYYGLLEPTGVAGAVQEKTQTFGIGGNGK